MAADTLETERQLAEFDARNSPQGLIERYARARVSLFLWRQIMTLLGVTGLVLLERPVLAGLAGALALVGEAADCLYLKTVPARLARGIPLARVAAISAATAAFQAATISICVGFAWLGAPGHSATAFALTFLLAAAINAGVVLPYNRLAGIARLAVYGATPPLLFAIDLVWLARAHQYAVFDFFAVMMMGYICFLFVRDTIKNNVQRAARSRGLLMHGMQLAQANQDLKKSQKESRNLSLVAKHANDSVIMSGPDRRIKWVNDAFTRITGYSADEAIGKTPADLLNAPETSQEESDRISRAVDEGRPFRTQILNQTKDGRKIWIGTNLVPVLDDRGAVELMIAIERDITDIKHREEELARAKVAAEKSEQAKAQFLASMSHEIRTPMNGIIGMADLLGEAALSDENRQYVDTIRQSGEALLTIINDILDFSKLDAGKPATHAVEFDLRAPLDGAVMLLAPQARAKGLYVDVVAETPLPERVLGDDGRLRQILINVIGNAIKFTPSGGVTVSLSCAADGDGYRVGFAVRDTGIGISPDRLEHVFEEFAQADTATTREFGGTGLGLSISRLLAREMGGDITLSSRPGEGSCFTITVRFDRVGTDRPKAAAGLQDMGDTLAGKIVLVAEDNKTNRLLVGKYLKDQPVALHFAENGREAVDKVAAHDPDIVLMDMAMPVMDGLAATREIRKTLPVRPRIIALTANAFASDKATCLAAGMDGFLSKPLRKGELLKALAQAGETPAPPGGA